MEITIYIKELLYNHDSVIVNGLGEFYAQYQHATIVSEKNIIAPPSKIVLFNAEKKQSDGLLENYIAFKMRFSVSNAQNVIKQDVSLIEKKLDFGQTLHFEGLGYLLKEDNVVRFKQETETNFNASSYGLQVVDFKPVDFKHPLKTESEVKKDKVQQKKSSLLPLLGKVAILLIVCGGAYFAYPTIKLYLLQPKSNVTKQVPKPDVKEPVKNTSADPLENYIDNTTDRKSALIPPSEKPTDIHFYVIAGSFKTYERAQVLAQELEKDGAKPEIIQFGTNVFRVSLGDFTDKRDAVLELERVRTIKGEESVWLLTQKK